MLCDCTGRGREAWAWLPLDVTSHSSFADCTCCPSAVISHSPEHSYLLSPRVLLLGDIRRRSPCPPSWFPWRAGIVDLLLQSLACSARPSSLSPRPWHRLPASDVSLPAAQSPGPMSSSSLSSCLLGQGEGRGVTVPTQEERGPSLFWSIPLHPGGIVTPTSLLGGPARGTENKLSHLLPHVSPSADDECSSDGSFLGL